MTDDAKHVQGADGGQLQLPLEVSRVEVEWDIYEGDALALLPTMPPDSVDMIFTDPPYGIPISTPIKPGAQARNQHMRAPTPEGLSATRQWVPGDDRADDIIRAFLPEAVRLLHPGGVLCCCCGGGGGAGVADPTYATWSLWMNQTPGLQFMQMVVWDKGPMGLGWRYRRSYEVVLVAARKGAPMRWFDTSKRVENIVRHIKKAVRNENTHPAEKPVALAAHFIGLHTEPGHVVLDPFCGCGSSGVAAVSAGRGFVGMDVHAAYAEESRRRVALAAARAT